MNLKSITTLGIISLTMAATSYVPANAGSMEQYLNVVAMQNLMNQQAAAAAAAQAAATPVATPVAPAPVAYNFDYNDKSRVDAERTRLVKQIYDLNYSLLHDSLSPRAYSRTQSKVARLQERLTRLNPYGT
ncbi:hypothetical protein KA183_05870 [bacterium]|nr:hypothetical protein [bacterium]QQR56721.1 MAG: hypothetical protein IPG59_17200 [Candidatus Melainabacteria bacterium]